MCLKFILSWVSWFKVFVVGVDNKKEELKAFDLVRRLYLFWKCNNHDI